MTIHVRVDGERRIARSDNDRQALRGEIMASENGDGASSAATKTGKGYRSLVMLLLFLVYAFNFLDRQIISILAIPIKEDLGLSDEQLGLLGGIAFAVLYSTLGVPIAWFADRMSRTWIMTAALTVWSGFTALSGFAQNFTHLFLARVGVGIGEAGGVAPAYTIIADYHPPAERSRALAIYSLGIPVGSAFGVIAGSQIAGGGISDALDWRSAFFIVGIAGIVLAPIFKLVVREPKRGQFDSVPTKKAEAKQEVGVYTDQKARILSMAGAVIFALPSLLSIFNITVFGATSQQSIPLLLAAAGVGAVSGWMAGQWVARTTSPFMLMVGLAVLMPLSALVAWFVPAFGGAGLSTAAVGWMIGHVIVGALMGAFFAAFRDFMSLALEKPSFWLMIMGASASSMMGYGVFFWLPSFFSRSFQLGLVETGWLFGGVLFVAGSLGIFLGGVMGDVMGKAKRSAFATVPAIAFLLSAPLYWAGIMAPSPMMAVIILFIPTALGLAWLGPVLSAFQHLMPPHMRTSASSVFLLINNLLGIGGGVYVLGRVSTVLQPTFGDGSLRISIVIGASLYLVAAFFMFWASRYLARDWEGDGEAVPVPQAEPSTEAEPS
ncbi:spinster family MFS transporter [Maricaulis maris]|uniref:spinster family MFS transporter n=1 Tax=Maricaulis maris TaxID=74318 RepID=UPI003A91AD97